MFRVFPIGRWGIRYSLFIIYCRTQNFSGYFNLANYSESSLSLTFSNANYNLQYHIMLSALKC